MSLLTLFNLYVSFIESPYARHEELVQPIRAYAHAIGMPATEVVHVLSSMYRPL